MRNTGQAKRDLVAVASHLSQLGFLVADCGVLSARVGEEILVTPGGVHGARLEARQLESVRLDGKSRVEVKPSSDLWTHLVIYREREDTGAILFAQPPHATGFAVAGEGLEEQILPEVILRLGPVPIIRHEGTGGIGESIRPHLGESQAFILANRGVVVIGSDPWEAASRLELVEHYARALLLGRLVGRVKALPEAQVARLVEERFADEGGRNR
jgi:L-fuculose-phosphate aldolase